MTEIPDVFELYQLPDYDTILTRSARKTKHLRGIEKAVSMQLQIPCGKGFTII